MGYHIGNVHTESGEIFRRVVIVGGLIVSVDRDREIPFDPEHMTSFELTHDKTSIL